MLHGYSRDIHVEATTQIRSQVQPQACGIEPSMSQDQQSVSSEKCGESTREEHSSMKIARTYKDAIHALNSLQSNFASIESRKRIGNTLSRNEESINSVFEFTRRLGYSPADLNRLNVIHVTGTKGKGSVCSFTNSILKQYSVKNGGPIRKIGLFTSPHLKHVRERIRINGEPIDESLFTKYFFEVWDKLSSTTSSPSEFPDLQPSAEVKPMYFKYLTILSFHVFMSEGVDTAIYEVGVGGTYDSTNIIEKPTVTAISSLGIDHTFMLGDTIESITWNKTGIFKKGCPAYVSEQPAYPQSIEVINSRALELGASSLEIVDTDILPADVQLGLAGDFQRQNAALAVKISSEHLSKLGVPSSDLPKFSGSTQLPPKFLAGLRDARWDGRCQIIENAENFKHITWYIDGAHTVESVKSSSIWFRDTVKRRRQIGREVRVLLFNQQNRENANSLLQDLYKSIVDGGINFDHVVFTTNITWSDGNYDPDLVSLNSSSDAVDKMTVQKSLAEAWCVMDKEKGRSSRKHIFPDIETGVKFIKSLTNDGSKVDAFVCGSLHLVGGVLVVLDGKQV
ncbi:Piso0_004005 [Millerozyma farinosa CBS 7064]|uniref:Folylpolyglutamate synthase n=1 Tax=Pichia sorbitophila (strain ATCC MYA-4447 / BCRC 22081 / CBS 7064 / NBRC 10061 / NRRL Y-12695) TaxID=559304 RepID=G8Y781_PICSO|nr:Piso0_004005 [Millerozyma farinosa CBS 7064]CCE84461.1 Piso0_004005 [Millerozyma farinosa CBS 7064]